MEHPVFTVEINALNYNSAHGVIVQSRSERLSHLSVNEISINFWRNGKAFSDAQKIVY